MPVTWGGWNGRGALVVNCALDPNVLANSIPGLSAVAVKIGGSDVADDRETIHCINVWRQRGYAVGCWLFNWVPADDVKLVLDTAARLGARWDFVVYDIEQPYKSDEGGHYEYAAQLVTFTKAALPGMPVAVTSYGGWKSSIDFPSFARAGWPILAQCYDAFHDGDEQSYKAVYLSSMIHRLTRRKSLGLGEWVYRPESID